MEMIIDKESFWQPAGLDCFIHTIKLRVIIITIITKKNYDTEITKPRVKIRTRRLVGPRPMLRYTLQLYMYLFFYLIKEIPTPAFLKIVFNNVITSCANIRYMRKCTAQCMYEKHRKPSSREHNLFFLYIELLKPRSWCERERLIPFIAAITTYSQQHSLVLNKFRGKQISRKRKHKFHSLTSFR